METNNIDKNIRIKFEKRTFKPSASAWERLSVQLDEQPKKKKKGWFFYISIAASIVLLLSISYTYIFKTNPEKPIKEIIVENPLDTNSVNKKINQFIDEIPVEKAIVKNSRTKEKQKESLTKNNRIISVKQQHQKIKETQNSSLNNNKTVIAQVVHDKKTTTKLIKKEKFIITTSPTNKLLKQDPNSRIKINSDDLLYAVTHSAQEVKKYYAKYNVNREDVIKTIKSELKKSNIKVNPNTILAEVERNIGEEDFQNNFMKSLKRKISDIATVIASRND